MTPSSAATTRRAMSMPPTPASILRTKAFVARDVDDGDFLAGRKGEPGEAEVDGHAPFLLLGEPVGVDASEGLDEGGLAVVHVARGAYDVHICFQRMRWFKDIRMGGWGGKTWVWGMGGGPLIPSEDSGQA